jgi:Arm DNA-binding domain
MKLTAKAVEKLRHEGPLHFRDIKDDATPGLYLRILASGRKRWVKRYKLGGKTRIGTIGDAGKIGLADARTKAFAWHAIIREGRDPAAEERREAEAQRRLPTCAAFAREYIERHAKPNKRSWAEDERLLRCDVLPAIGDLRIDTIARRDIVLLLDAIRDRGAAVLANRVLGVTRRMFAFAIERGVIAASPFVGIKASRETARAYLERRRIAAVMDCDRSRKPEHRTVNAHRPTAVAVDRREGQRGLRRTPGRDQQRDGGMGYFVRTGQERPPAPHSALRSGNDDRCGSSRPS